DVQQPITACKFIMLNNNSLASGNKNTALKIGLLAETCIQNIVHHEFFQNVIKERFSMDSLSIKLGALVVFFVFFLIYIPQSPTEEGMRDLKYPLSIFHFAFLILEQIINLANEKNMKQEIQHDCNMIIMSVT
ncbi:hypothetical protein ACJX0J_013213, partial [Zea mays]